MLTPAQREVLLTDELYEAAQSLATGRVTYCVGSWDKRFARDISALPSGSLITEKQRDQIWRMVWRYKRQIANQKLVEIAQRITPQGKERVTGK
jgi:hypothetical protein